MKYNFIRSLCEQLQRFSGDANEDSLISCLKELTQLLIWGDQHDPLLLEHFFEQNVHEHFLKILESKHNGSLIVQVLQTLNIMFENVRSQESLYFLLSNNYVNRIICLKYDFSNDEILAYYIYLLRTLSFKLSKDTIYFFFNEHLDDFPLYSEAIKFFNHEESMIRIAVRIITLNVYSVNDEQMQDFILDRTTTTYFSNLVWFIGNYGTTINDMLLHLGDGEYSRINYYLAEHMDCFYYVNDIIELEVSKINKILISHLLNRLLRPMYLDSLISANAQSSSGSKSSAVATGSPKLMPLVALSLMLHAFHVLKHAPLVSALTSTLFSNQHYSSSHHQHNHQNHQHSTHPRPHSRQSPSPLMTGAQSVSPESSRPASPVTSKFHSFGLLGSSPASPDITPTSFSNVFTSVAAPIPSRRGNGLHSLSPQPQSSSAAAVTQRQQENQECGQQHNVHQNPYKTVIYEYMNHVEDDQLVLPALTLIYLAGRNPGIMSDVLLGTDIYPQRLLKSRLLMGNLTSSPAPSKKGLQEGTTMSRERSGDSILSTGSTGTGAATGSWSISTPGSGGVAGSVSLFGAVGALAAAARMRTRTESPLFEAEEGDEESRETEELLASEDPEPAMPPPALSSSSTASLAHSSSSYAGLDEGSSKALSSSLPSSSMYGASSNMARNYSIDGGVLIGGNKTHKPRSAGSARKIKSRSNSKTPSILGTILPASTAPSSTIIVKESNTKNEQQTAEDKPEMGQELKPMKALRQDREPAHLYPSTDEDDEEEAEADMRKIVGTMVMPPPLPPRRSSYDCYFQQQQQEKQESDETASVQESARTQVGPLIQNREQLIDRLMDIICGRPESGAHRFRIITIQMATELLIEFVFTKGVSATTATSASSASMKDGTGAPNSSHAAAQQAAERELGETRLQRLAIAETQFRKRVQKGIRRLERQKRKVTKEAHGGQGQTTLSQPLGLLTGRVERAMTESKLGIDKQIVNIIAESSVIYGPDKGLENEPDLDPPSDLIRLFNLNASYARMRHKGFAGAAGEGSDTEDTALQRPVSDSPVSTLSMRESKRSRSRTRSKIRSMIRGASEPRQPLQHQQATDVTTSSLQLLQSRLSDLQHLEAMVVRYIKWLHILIQCRQLLCRKATLNAATQHLSPTPAVFMTRALAAGSSLQPTMISSSVAANSGSGSVKMSSPSISVTVSSEKNRDATPALTPTPPPPRLERRPSDLLGGAGGGSAGSSSSGAAASAHKGLQKALATTATTTAAVDITHQGEVDPLGSIASGTAKSLDVVSNPLTASSLVSSSTTSKTVTDSTLASTAHSSAFSSTSSLASQDSNSSPAVAAKDSLSADNSNGTHVSATLSQPASGTASGRVIGSRTLLTATAALEAAAISSGSLRGGSGSSFAASSLYTRHIGHHPFINDMLTNHLDPLSANVSEVIRKSSARIKKSVVDPLSTSPLFKSSLLSTSVEEKENSSGNRGIYRPMMTPSGVSILSGDSTSSSASSMLSFNAKPVSGAAVAEGTGLGPNGLQRSTSATSSNSWISHSVATIVGGSAPMSTAAAVSEDHATLNNESTPPASGKTVIPGGDEQEEDEDDDGDQEKSGDGVPFKSILDPGHLGRDKDDDVVKILKTLGLSHTFS
ncbi:hypothetical protein EDD11_005615 [Mortierella claussenii]|nr:hypothetical protein EDD11_005615 [Mortierella claussenii]